MHSRHWRDMQQCCGLKSHLQHRYWQCKSGNWAKKTLHLKKQKTKNKYTGGKKIRRVTKMIAVLPFACHDFLDYLDNHVIKWHNHKCADMLHCANFEHLNNDDNNSTNNLWSTQTTHDTQHKILKFCYLIVLSIGFGVVRVGVVLEELSHVGHDGLLIWFIHVHILRNAAQWIHICKILMTFCTKDKLTEINKANGSLA